MRRAGACSLAVEALWSRAKTDEDFALGLVIPFDDKASDPGLEALAALVAANMNKVNQTILARTGSDVAMIPEVANHLISSGGKRLRPMLVLAAAGRCG